MFAAESGAVLDGLDGKQHALGGYLGQSKWTVIAVSGPRGEPVAKQPGRVSNRAIEDFIAKSTVLASAVG